MTRENIFSGIHHLEDPSWAAPADIQSVSLSGYVSSQGSLSEGAPVVNDPHPMWFRVRDLEKGLHANERDGTRNNNLKIGGPGSSPSLE